MKTNKLLFHIAAAVTLAALAAPQGLRGQGGFNGPGRYEIANLKSGKVLDLDRNDQTTVIQFSPRNTDNQFWDIRPAEPGFWFIRNAMTGAALEPVGMNNSAPVRGVPFNSGPPQQWRIAPGKDGNPLITSRLGKTLDIPNGTSRDGARIQIYDLNGDSNQRFVFRRVGELPRDADRDRDRRWEQYEGRFDDRDRTWKIEGDGACFYREPGFRGRAFCLHVGEEMHRLPDEWVGVFQSARLFGRARAVVFFTEGEFGGRRVRIEHDMPDLGPMERHIVSARVH